MTASGPELLLVGAVAGVGVLHTMVPDHWLPIAVVARREGWSRRETARAALQAGTGHVLSTLLIGLAVWLAGIAFATRFGTLVSTASSLALILFGGWIAVAAIRELRAENARPHVHADGFSHDGPGASGHAHHHHSHDAAAGIGRPHAHDRGHDHDHDHEPEHSGVAVLTKHTHVHAHGAGTPHVHPHEHDPGTLHDLPSSDAALPLQHEHAHARSGRLALLLILGSSPMVEGLPAFFAAGRYGPGLLAVMSLVFAASTILTYVVLCVSSTAGLQRVRLGPFERFGEVLSGALIALVGAVFLAFPIA